MRVRSFIGCGLGVLVVLGSWTTPGYGQREAIRDSTSCLKCHATMDEEDLALPALEWAKDVHAVAGLGCESCHGGNPKPLTTDDFDEAADFAMDPDNGFLELPDRLEIPTFCARCHSDPEYMKRFDPQIRVDQLAEYRTSVHGKLNAEGDETPATCIDCHGIHGIRPVTSPESPAHATNVPSTCAKCHADESIMEPYGIPTNQYESYKRSEHAHALLTRGDIAAPACNDCHGNHGATPPEVSSISNVCGQCHGRERTLFEASSHKAIFEEAGKPPCITCHGSHLVLHPTPELFRSGSRPQVTRGQVVGLDPFVAEVGDLGPRQTVTATWRTVLAPHRPPGDSLYWHHVEIHATGVPHVRLDATMSPGDTATRRLEHESAASGLSVKLWVTPVAGFPVQSGDALMLRLDVTAHTAHGASNVVIRDVPGDAVQSHAGSACMQCHTAGDSCDAATDEMYEVLMHMDGQMRTAHEALRRAEIAGMEVREAQFDLKSAGTTAAIEARALIHAFVRSRLIQRTADGVAAANDAIEAGDAALAELHVRRVGLAISLVLVMLVLFGLFLKIRDVERVRSRQNRPVR